MSKQVAWYATNGFKIGAGVVGILFVLGALLVVNTILPGSGTDSETTIERVSASAPSTVRSENDPGDAPVAGAPAVAAIDAGDAQEIRMSVLSYEYAPSAITVQAGKPVRWIVDGSQASGCTQYLVAPEFGISQRLQRGENIIEFMPTQKGTFGFACGMGMVEGTITVV